MIESLPHTAISWCPSYRIVPSRYPPVGLFDRVADPDDLAVVLQVEGLTNDRLREAAGDISLVPPEDQVFGPGTTPIMAAFTHLNPAGSRFSDGSYGVYYAANQVETAIRETRYHTERFMRYSNEKPQRLSMRVYQADIVAPLLDIRDSWASHPQWYDPGDYGPAQQLGGQARAGGEHGIVYLSVRDPEGECVAIFRPRVIAPVVQGAHYDYVWNGDRITDVLEVSRVM